MDGWMDGWMDGSGEGHTLTGCVFSDLVVICRVHHGDTYSGCENGPSKQASGQARAPDESVGDGV